MNILKIIEELREERACLDEVLISLEKLSLKRTPRRGRPPAWSKVASLTVSKTSVTASKSSNGLNGSTHVPRPLAASAGKSTY
jgi:hypothetical protein